jgi:hypothetical protein
MLKSASTTHIRLRGLAFSPRNNFASTFFLQTQEAHKKYDEDYDDEDDSADNSLRDQEPPYLSLTSPGGMKRYGTMASLDMERTAEDSTDSESGGEWESDAEGEGCNMKQQDSGKHRMSVEVTNTWSYSSTPPYVYVT